MTQNIHPLSKLINSVNMRPLDEAFAGRSRSTSFTDSTPTPQPPQAQYFMADESTMEASLSRSAARSTRSRDSMKRSNYGVESLENTISSLNQDSDDQDSLTSRARKNWKKGLAKDMKKDDEDVILESRPSSSSSSSMAPSQEMSPSESRVNLHHDNTQPMTPFSLQSPVLASIASTSRRNSESDFLTDELGSQAIVSGAEEDNEVPSEQLDSSASQLVMPSIKMPSRRPFTDRGKNMGRLKIMIAGDSGMYNVLMLQM